ncbi:MAG: hypothetical protein G01um10148_431 [Parcubacteria group bacterium Gr01-1014_8]|nr:MAG: hypothetical protein G01um10148_431 [Parcubacteria group bacterium Gr01-1014_8]
MEIVTLGKDLGGCVLKASGILRHGGVIIFPTDTLYGLGADALSDEAVAKIYGVKGRNEGKPMHAIFANLEMAAEYAEINDAAIKLAKKFLPGALTLVLKKKKGVDTGIVKGIDTIGMRIPDNDFCLDLAKTFGKPYTATSANKAGSPPQLSSKKVLEQLGRNAEQVDLVVDDGLLPMRLPTTVVNVVSDYPVILREGAIPPREILG